MNGNGFDWNGSERPLLIDGDSSMKIRPPFMDKNTTQKSWSHQLGSSNITYLGPWKHEWEYRHTWFSIACFDYQMLSGVCKPKHGWIWRDVINNVVSSGSHQFEIPVECWNLFRASELMSWSKVVCWEMLRTGAATWFAEILQRDQCTFKHNWVLNS